jgi:hypothetical protein
MKLGSLGLPQHRLFALEEIEEATNNFESFLYFCLRQIQFIFLFDLKIVSIHASIQPGFMTFD